MVSYWDGQSYGILMEIHKWFIFWIREGISFTRMSVSCAFYMCIHEPNDRKKASWRCAIMCFFFLHFKFVLHYFLFPRGFVHLPFFPLWIKLLYVYPFLIDCALFSLRTCHAHTLKILNPKTLSFCSRLHITRIGNMHARKFFLEKCEVTSPSHEQVFFFEGTSHEQVGAGIINYS